MLFIDNPVGAGFSYTGTGNGTQKTSAHVPSLALNVLMDWEWI
jgi:carboxypeptidase C (cathepsin A)